MTVMEIIPTILTKDLDDLENKLQRLSGEAPRVQIDVIDGVFAPNKTFSLEALKDYDHRFKTELHLMVKEPIDWINRSREVMADRIVAQVEMMSDTKRFLEEVASSGMEVGLALDLKTPVEKISADIYPQLDIILLMAVPAGLGGQDFDPVVLEKIKKIREIVGDLVEIGVDGGLNKENILKCKEVGANVFYLGKTFWEAEDLGRRYRELLGLIK
jgi:ribulose-phosphate 3-epimerase